MFFYEKCTLLECTGVGSINGKREKPYRICPPTLQKTSGFRPKHPVGPGGLEPPTNGL